MKILAIDTSGQRVGVAVVENGAGVHVIVVEAHTEPRIWKHSEMLMPTIARMLKEAGLTLADMGCVAYTNGPGSFTGLRIGAATALGLSKGCNLLVVPVPTLDAMAYNGLKQNGAHVVPMMDARRGQVYAAVYKRGASGEVERLTEYLAAPEGEVLAVAGDAVVIKEAVDPVAVGLLASDLWGAPRKQTPHAELLYIRAPQVYSGAAGNTKR